MTPRLSLAVIVGPTATGKTRLGVEVAHRLGSEIISADSRQVYTGLDLGTGKDVHEYHAVSPPVAFHLIDICHPRQRYTLFDYQRDCYRVLSALAKRDRYRTGAAPLVMVGGTGLYVEAVISRYRIADVRENPDLRRRLGRLERDELVARLEAADPRLHGRTDLSSFRRVIRALEIADAASRGPVSYSEPPEIEIRSAVFGVKADRQTLCRRIADRVHQRLADGMVGEVRGLLEQGLSPRRLHELGLEYRAIGRHLQGETSIDEMTEELIGRIVQFAKRQMTYFRGMERRGIPIRWIEPGDVETIVEAMGR